MTAGPVGFTCPRCGRTSYHPTDMLEGYCGACHDWTRSPRFDAEPAVPVDDLAKRAGALVDDLNRLLAASNRGSWWAIALGMVGVGWAITLLTMTLPPWVTLIGDGVVAAMCVLVACLAIARRRKVRALRTITGSTTWR